MPRPPTPAPATTAVDRVEAYLRRTIAEVTGRGDRRLPTVRAIAAATGTWRTQVEEAVGRLVREGLIEVRPKVGMYTRQVDVVTRDLVAGARYEYQRAVAGDTGDRLGLFEQMTGLDPAAVQVTWTYFTGPCSPQVAARLGVANGHRVLRRVFTYRLRTPAPQPGAVPDDGDDATVPVEAAAAAMGVPAHVLLELARAPWARSSSPHRTGPRPGAVPALTGDRFDRAEWRAWAYDDQTPVVSTPLLAVWVGVGEQAIRSWAALPAGDPGRKGLPEPADRGKGRRLTWTTAAAAGWVDDMLATPHQVATSWMTAERAKACGLGSERAERAGVGTIAQLLAGGYRPAVARYVIASRAPSPVERDQMGLPGATPVLEWQRDLLDERGTVLEVSTTVVAADTGRLRAEVVFDPADRAGGVR